MQQKYTSLRRCRVSVFECRLKSTCDRVYFDHCWHICKFDHASGSDSIQSMSIDVASESSKQVHIRVDLPQQTPDTSADEHQPLHHVLQEQLSFGDGSLAVHGHRRHKGASLYMRATHTRTHHFAHSCICIYNRREHIGRHCQLCKLWHA